MAAFFYTHFQSDPYYNMAFDEWLLGRTLTAPGSVFLRLYTWKIGTITIGFNQNQDMALDHTRCGDTPVIRRITGGRALYHDPHELTYAIAANIADGGIGRLSGSVSETSTVIAEALVKFIAHFGIGASYVRRSSAENSAPAFFHKAPCFASVAKYEVIGGAGKVVASAQKRVGPHAFLQHGSIKVHGVVLHPALNPEVAQVGEAEQLLGAAQFARASEIFRVTMSEGLGIAVEAASGVGGNDSLMEHVNTVQKNPLAKRDPIKQRIGASSL